MASKVSLGSAALYTNDEFTNPHTIFSVIDYTSSGIDRSSTKEHIIESVTHKSPT